MKQLYFTFLIFITACSVNTEKQVNLEELSFNYTDDAYLYFRNLRQTNYDIEVLEESAWRIYRHEDRQKDTTGFYFNVALVVNWRVNKVYPILEMSQSAKSKGFQVYWNALETNENGIIELEGVRRNDEMYFVSALYNQMPNEVEMYVRYQEKRLPLFTSSEQKEAFRITLYDFYRMTGLL